MRECILLFQFEPVKQRKLAAQLLTAKFRVKAVSQEELDFPIGYLAGDKELLTVVENERANQKSAEDGQCDRKMDKDAESTENEVNERSYTGSAHLPAPMIVMAGVTGNRLNTVLQAIRKSGIGAVPYKAVLTETNRTWKAKELLQELMKEHEEMKKQNGEGQMIHEQ